MTREFSGGISEGVLRCLLARAVTHNNAINSATIADDLRMLHDLGARFLGRAAYIWVPEADDDRHFAKATDFARRVHLRDPEVVCQAAIFEAVYPVVDTIPVPDWVFVAFGEPVEERCFRYAAMASPDFRRDLSWSRQGDGCQVPDLTCPETQRWFYYRARRYLDAGYEAIHLGQPHLYCGRDHGWRCLDRVIGLIRACAARHARRAWVLLDAHTHGIAIGSRLLLDFHSRPFSAVADRAHPEELILHWKGGSLGGTAPSGWTCAQLPYLIEVDNYGGQKCPPERWDDREYRAATGRWGYDDIAWFAHQERAGRHRFLEYAHRLVRGRDAAAFFQPPTRRILGQAPVRRPGADGSPQEIWHYHANRLAACPSGFDDEDAIAAVWAASPPSWLAVHHAAVAAHDQAPAVTAGGAAVNRPVALLGQVQTALGGLPGDTSCPYSRLRHIGQGVFELPLVLHHPGVHGFNIAVGGTRTEVHRASGLGGGRECRLVTTVPNAEVLVRYEADRHRITAWDPAGRELDLRAIGPAD
jgi:hypothetical protein